MYLIHNTLNRSSHYYHMMETKDWDTYFMDMAYMVSTRSKDPITKVGAVIVDQKNRVQGIGYNGFPRGVKETTERWSKFRGTVDDKSLYVIHGEMNAILNSSGDLTGATIYTTTFPCNRCAGMIIQTGIKEVVFSKLPNNTSSVEHQVSQAILEEADVTVTKLLT
jgi:dCMP deaminase